MYILLMFKNITEIIKDKLSFKWFQMDKDDILQQKNYQHY